MSGNGNLDLRNEPRRQHIGPAVKELRTRQGWSLRDLEARCGVSSAYLSRIERGSSVPSFSILASIANALRVSPEYFTEFERSAKNIESSLAELLHEAGIPRSTWGEFADLSMEAQESLVNALQILGPPVIDTDHRLHELEVAVQTDGVEAMIPTLSGAVRHEGMSAVDFARHRTQIEEAEGDRVIMLDRLCTLPASWVFDQRAVAHGAFAVEPENPMLVKWWIRAQRSALVKTLDGSGSRVIYPRAAISHYIRTGEWGRNVHFDPVTVREHIDHTIRLLRMSTSYRIGLLDGEIPFRLIGKEGAGFLFMDTDDTIRHEDGSSRIALRFSVPETTKRFMEYFDDLWASIPESQSEPEQVIAWLESELDAGFAAWVRLGNESAR